MVIYRGQKMTVAQMRRFQRLEQAGEVSAADLKEWLQGEPPPKPKPPKGDK